MTLMVLATLGVRAQNTFENNYSRPLSEVLDEISARYRIKLKYNVDTTGLMLPHADSRLRLYSAEESLAGVLAPFDMKAVKQHDSLYKIKYYEPHVRMPEDGAKMLAWLGAKYNDSVSFERRRAELRRDVRKALGLDEIMARRVNGGRGGEPIFSKIRKHDGYATQKLRHRDPQRVVCLRYALYASDRRHAPRNPLSQRTFRGRPLLQRTAVAIGDAGPHGGSLCVV